MKRAYISIESLLSMDNLYSATYLAARRKRDRVEVKSFLQHLDNKLLKLQNEVKDGEGPLGSYKSFTIYDPKKRNIYAADFPYRVLHHALMRHAGPLLDSALVSNTFACRTDKGIHRAVTYVQKQLRRFPYFVQIDIDSYFSQIHHPTLMDQLKHRFKGKQFLSICQRILQSYHTSLDKGLPIGSLCSQYWANEYLNGFDRMIQSESKTFAYCRYMDDILWWCHSRQDALELLKLATTYLSETLFLNIKPNPKLGSSKSGVNYCGFEIRQGIIHPSRRKRQKYKYSLITLIDLFENEKIDESQLQQGILQSLSVLSHTESTAWRKHVLKLIGSRCNGLSCEPWRQLEQPRAELALS